MSPTTSHNTAEVLFAASRDFMHDEAGKLPPLSFSWTDFAPLICSGIYLGSMLGYLIVVPAASPKLPEMMASELLREMRF
jgi:hypothetical protein